ncbi:molecular chaperone [Escherichia coli]|nr:molecular chaperone [Escherichia coli]EFC1447910.1 molecular chaperone [Escherichia coli]EFC1600254.1 molecular chaperone [Escherichia coli]
MFRITFFFVIGLFSLHAQASIVVMGTRVVYPAQDKSINVQINNSAGDPPSLVQSWMDTGDASATPDAIKVPFIITPPVFRIEPKAGQTLRILYTQEPLPDDRESLFYLNVLEIPAKPKLKNSDGQSMNYLQLAVRNRIKFFFRPDNLSVSQADAFQKVTWKIERNGNDTFIRGDNPTPYYITYNQIVIEQGGKSIIAKQGGMVAPFSSSNFHITGQPAPGAKVKWTVVNDYSGHLKGETPLL